MKQTRFLTGFLVVLLAMSGICFGQTAAEHIAAGDGFYTQYNDQKALDEYMAAVTLEPANYEALWKTARSLVDVADLIDPATANIKETQKKMYSDGVTYARKAISVNPNDTWGHFFLSAAMGKKLLLLSTKEQVNASKIVRAEIDKAIELDGQNDLAYHALGRWHRRMAEIGGAKRFFGGIIYGSIPKGSFQESEKALLKAVELKPEYVNHYLELGRTYMSLKKYDLAAEAFQKTIDLPISSSKDTMLKDEAKAELAVALKKKT